MTERRTAFKRAPDRLGLPCYQVVDVDGTVLGHVFRCQTTHERRPKGARYVTRRWTSTSRWSYSPSGRLGTGRRFDTRKEATAALYREVFS